MIENSRIEIHMHYSEPCLGINGIDSGRGGLRGLAEEGELQDTLTCEAVSKFEGAHNRLETHIIFTIH